MYLDQTSIGRLNIGCRNLTEQDLIKYSTANKCGRIWIFFQFLFTGKGFVTLDGLCKLLEKHPDYDKLLEKHKHLKTVLKTHEKGLQILQSNEVSSKNISSHLKEEPKNVFDQIKKEERPEPTHISKETISQDDQSVLDESKDSNESKDHEKTDFDQPTLNIKTDENVRQLSTMVDKENLILDGKEDKLTHENRAEVLEETLPQQKVKLSKELSELILKWNENPNQDVNLIKEKFVSYLNQLRAKNPFNMPVRKFTKFLELCVSHEQMKLILDEVFKVDVNCHFNLGSIYGIQGERTSESICQAIDYERNKKKVVQERKEQIEKKYQEEGIYKNPFKCLDVDYTKLNLNLEEEGVDCFPKPKKMYTMRQAVQDIVELINEEMKLLENYIAENNLDPQTEGIDKLRSLEFNLTVTGYEDVDSRILRYKYMGHPANRWLNRILEALKQANYVIDFDASDYHEEYGIRTNNNTLKVQI